MKTLRTLIGIALAAGMTSAFAQSQVVTAPVAKPATTVGAPLPATTVLAEARARAKAENKNVFVIFHASWCGWCKRLDKFMNDPQFKPLFDDNFVTVHLTVQEDEQHKADENPGGLDEMASLSGGSKEVGLPFFGIIDAEGKAITTSMRAPIEKEEGPQNTGFPAADFEIDHFAKMMEMSARKLMPEEIAMMKAYLVYQEASRKAAAAKKAAAKKTAEGAG